MSELTGESKRKAAPGWYDDPKLSDTKRYWDGQAWTDHRRETRIKPAPLPWGERPEGLMWGALLLALVLGLVAGFVWMFNDKAGLIAALAATYFTSALFAIGIIAKGVELGIRAARHRPDLDF